MKKDFTVIPTIAIHPDKIVFFKRFEGLVFSRNRGMNLPEKFDTKNHDGIISDNTARKIKRAISYLIAVSSVKVLESQMHQKKFPWRVSFVTLTLPSKQVHSDNEIKNKCLHQFLIEASKKWNITHYVWRSEHQANGNIHFHILTNRFIPWQELRDVWNRCTEKLGYVTNYRKEMKDFHSGNFRVRNNLLKQWSYKNQLKAYHEGRACDWSSPNSTDVHSVKKIKNLMAYVCKYVLKEDVLSDGTSRQWGCSYALSRAKGAKVDCDNAVFAQLSRLRELFKPKEWCKEHFYVMFIKFSEYAKSGLNEIITPFREYMQASFQVDPSTF